MKDNWLLMKDIIGRIQADVNTLCKKDRKSHIIKKKT